MSPRVREPDTDVELVYEGIRRDPFWNHLRDDGTNPFVPGEGSESPQVFLVGEAPGAQEAIKRRPFVGASGAVLRQLMSFAELSTEDRTFPNEPGAANAWITNVIKYRPPANRTPTDGEIAKARKALSAEWVALGKPRIIVAVGGTALFAFLGRRVSILRVAGEPFAGKSLCGPNTTLWPMIHPAFGLRNPQAQENMERHWEALGAWLSDQTQQAA